MKFCYHVHLIKRVQNFVCIGSFTSDFLVKSIILSSTWSETTFFIIVKCQRLLHKCHLYSQLKLEVFWILKLSRGQYGSSAVTSHCHWVIQVARPMEQLDQQKLSLHSCLCFRFKIGRKCKKQSIRQST